MNPILTITNRHVPSCGTPPQIDPEGKRVSYFQNQHGEQWFFISDDESQTGVLTGGDIDWTEHTITWDSPLPEISLSMAETYWLYGCLFALFQKTQPEIMQHLAEAEKNRPEAIKAMVCAKANRKEDS